MESTLSITYNMSRQAVHEVKEAAKEASVTGGLELVNGITAAADWTTKKANALNAKLSKKSLELADRIRARAQKS